MEPAPNAIDLILDEIAERFSDLEFVDTGSETHREIEAEIHGLCTAIDLMSGADDTYGRLIVEGQIKDRITARRREVEANISDFLSGRKPNLSIVK